MNGIITLYIFLKRKIVATYMQFHLFLQGCEKNQVHIYLLRTIKKKCRRQPPLHHLLRIRRQEKRITRKIPVLDKKK